MKTKLLSTITLIAFTLTSFNISLADDYLPPIKDIKNIIDLGRKVDSSDYKNAICYSKNSNSKGDIDLIKKAFTNTYNYYVNALELNKSNIEKIRSLTDQELKDYNESKRLFDLEKSIPSNPSWKACDTLVSSFYDNVSFESDLFMYKKTELGEEYKNTIFIKKHDKLNYYTSSILNADVAVVKSSNLAKTIKEVLTYKAFIIEKVNTKGSVVGFYLFVKNETVTNKNVMINGLENKTIDSNYLAKLYKQVNSEWKKEAPITKVINGYYFYNIYKN